MAFTSISPIAVPKCRYCDFYSTPCPDGVPESNALTPCAGKWTVFALRLTPLRPDTLYFGGGTPSLPAQAARLIRAAGPAPGAEITLEANPETVTPERLAAFRRAGVNRLSLGIQTARDDSLARLGRRHTAAQSRRALGMAVQAGFTDISGDLMLALPAYTMAELDETIALLAESGCTRISGYLLKIEPNTVFGKRPAGSAARRRRGCGFLSCRRGKSWRRWATRNTKFPISPAPALKAATTGSIGTAAIIFGLGPAAHSCMGGKRFATPAGTAAFLAAPAGVRTPGRYAPPKITSCASSVFPAGFH